MLYYINFSELQGYLLLWKHGIFTCEDKFDIFTCEDNNDVVCAITFTKFNCRTSLNSFLCDRNIFDDSSETFGNLRQSSKIFGHLRKFSENDRKCSYELRTLLREFWKIFGKCSEIFGKLLKYPWFCCLYNKQNVTCPLVDTNFLVFNSISHSFAALTHEISSWTLEDKTRIHALAWNIPYLQFN